MNPVGHALPLWLLASVLLKIGAPYRKFAENAAPDRKYAELLIGGALYFQ
jgi:hypothetical protein